MHAEERNPVKRWKDVINRDLAELGATPNDAPDRLILYFGDTIVGEV